MMEDRGNYEDRHTPDTGVRRCQPSIESASDTEMYALRDLIASHIVCEADCRSMPTGCGCALTAARSIVNSHASLKADLAQCTEANHHYRDAVDVLEANARVQARLLADTGRRAEGLEAALRSVSSQCGNVIYNCEQRPADNQRHLDSWKGVKEFADAALSPKPAGETDND